jgi:hypothetical protein
MVDATDAYTDGWIKGVITIFQQPTSRIAASYDPALQPSPVLVILSRGVAREANGSAVEGPAAVGSTHTYPGILTVCDFSPVQISLLHLFCLIV